MPKAVGAAANGDTEWLFDYLLTLFRCPTWDLAVMGFIDENCAVFDNEEENKLAYTTLHHQFKELVETLCANSLAEVGVDVGDFVEALEASRLRQDMGTAVYQQLVALDDFVTFKKLMVKRNVELELEAVHALQAQGVPIQHGNEDGVQEDGEESAGDGEGGHPRTTATTGPRGETKRDKPAAWPGRGRSALDKQLQQAIDANLQELELMHKREAVEQAELEQAIAMSLALETKRAEYATIQDGIEGGGENHRQVLTSETGCKSGDVYDTEGTTGGGGGPSRWRQSKKQDTARGASHANDSLAEAKCDLNGHRELAAEEKNCMSLPPSSGGRMKGEGSKALPPLSNIMAGGAVVAPIGGGSGEGRKYWGLRADGGATTTVQDLDVESAKRRREAQAAAEKAKQLLDERRQAQKSLKAQSEVSEEDSAQRERHLKDMRDRIVRAKRAGREEQASKAASDSAAATATIAGGGRVTQATTGGGAPAGGTTMRGGSSRGRGGGKDEKEGGDGSDDGPVIAFSGKGVEDDLAETQRRMMRVALAQHMKRELIASEQDRLTKIQAEQLADLNGKLRLVEKLRNENSEREAEIAAALREQQRQRAWNMVTSAAAARGYDDDEFTFGEAT